MEVENQADLNASTNQEADSRLNKPIGKIEHEKLEAKNVKVVSVELREQKRKDGTRIADILHIMVKHPDKEEFIDISKVLFLKDRNVKETGLWYGEDKEGNIQKGSALSHTLDYYKVNSMIGLVDKELQTESNDAGYLCIKAY